MFNRLALLLVICLIHPVNTLALSAKSAILIDGHTGRVLMEQNARERMGMASTTKIMTALIALEEGDLNSEVEISYFAAGMIGSSMYLKSGEKITLLDLIYGLMLNSGNDAAAAIAEHIGKDMETFADLMTQKAKSFGLNDTSFANSHGLDADNHYTTAYDLAQITRRALEIPLFAQIAATKAITIGMGENARTLVNHNKMLSLYKGATGVKTGFTKKCGRCLVSSATRDCLKLIAVTLNAPDDWNDHKQMLDYGFANYKWKSPVKKGDYMKAVPLMGAEYDKILLYAGEGVELAAKSGDVIKVVYDVPNFVQAPVFNGQRIGSAQVLLSGKVIKTINLIAAEDIAPTNEDRYKKTYFYIFRELYRLFR